MQHYLWSTDDRRADTGRYCYGTAACLSGDGHARHALILKDVDCPACLESPPFKRALAREAVDKEIKKAGVSAKEASLIHKLLKGHSS